MLKIEKHLFTIGPRNCGKSEYIERYMDIFSSKLYIGTLWQSKSFDEIIQRHKQRRDKTWQLYEISGGWGRDLRQIDNLMNSPKRVEACLADGLITWAENIAGFRKNRLMSAIDSIIGTVTYLMNKNPEVVWFFIDVDPTVLRLEQRDDEALICEKMHQRLINRITPLKILYWENMI